MRSLRSKLVLFISLLVAALVGAAGFIEVRKRSTELNQELLETSENFSAMAARCFRCSSVAAIRFASYSAD